MPDSLPYSFSNLSKVYRLYAAPRDRFFEALTGRPRHAEVRALDDVSGGIAKGSVLGVIGENGSGKSTLFKILAGTTAATSGSVSLPGRVASILELGSAFHPDDTGRRNVILQAALSGLSREEVAAALPEIEAFAELGDFFDRPVKTYSSGMQMRLAFSVATAVLPDVILLDEALAVGDGRFQKKCVDRIFELKASGKTIFFCSHAMYYVSTLCDRALWLNAGRVEAAGDAQSVVLEYERFLARKDRRVAPHGAEAAVPAETHGSVSRLRAHRRRRTREGRVPAGRAVGRGAGVRRPTIPRGPSRSISRSPRATTSCASRRTRGSTARGRSPGSPRIACGSASTRFRSGRESSSSTPTLATRSRSRSSTRGATARSTSNPTLGGAAS